MNPWRIPAFLVLTLSQALVAQDTLPRLHPKLGAAPDLSPAAFARFAELDSLLNEVDQLSLEGTQRLEELYDDIGELWESPCDVVGLGCSWYCGGGPDTVWASSQLAPLDGQRFDAGLAHDLSYCAAWAEGVAGPGIGEWMAYGFAADSPRLHTVFVSNGLVTDTMTWRAHGRVKELLMSENGVPVAILQLADTREEQSFSLPRMFGRRSDGAPMVLTFSILSVFPGDRHAVTVITELWFDGTDVH
jgi:hypothetical protein